MGYSTDFEGAFELDRPLTPEHKAYLTQFSETRRMKRDEWKAVELPDPIREAVKLPVGHEGEYFIGGTGEMGQRDDPSIVDHSSPPMSQPGLWCQWTPSPDGKYIVWDGGEKFYHYRSWISYIISNFLMPWGYVLNGTVTWQGEESNDKGQIVVVNNQIQTKFGKVVYE